MTNDENSELTRAMANVETARQLHEQSINDLLEAVGRQMAAKGHSLDDIRKHLSAVAQACHGHPPPASHEAAQESPPPGASVH